MNRKKLEKIKRHLLDLRANPRGIRSSDLSSIARSLGRSLSNRGKEPTYVNEADWFEPELNPKVRAFAAHYGTVFLPARNEPDLEDVPADVLAELDVRPVGDVADILAFALDVAPAHQAAA